MTRFPLRSAAWCQATIIAATIVGAAVWPPAQGAMLLVPLSGEMRASVAVTLDAGAALAARGPLPGSVVVIGDRAAVAGPALRHGIVTLAAPRTICGTAEAAA